MQRAIDACVSGGMAIRQAALRFGVPKSTLGDRISGRVLPGASYGPKGYLTPEEEEELVNFLLRCAAMGYPKSRHEVLALVKRIWRRNRLMLLLQVDGGSHSVADTQILLSGHLHPFLGHEPAQQIQKLYAGILIFWNERWLIIN